jgi:hypothetical protein
MRRFRFIAESLPEFFDRSVQSLLEVNERVFWPQAFVQFFAGYKYAGMFEKNGENVDGLGLEFETEAVAKKFSGVKVNFEWPEANSLLVENGHNAPQAARSIASK